MSEHINSPFRRPQRREQEAYLIGDKVGMEAADREINDLLSRGYRPSNTDHLPDPDLMSKEQFEKKMGNNSPEEE